MLGWPCFPADWPEVKRELRCRLVSQSAPKPFSGDCRYRRDDRTGIALSGLNYLDPVTARGLGYSCRDGYRLLRWARAGAVGQRRVPLALKIF